MKKYNQFNMSRFITPTSTRKSDDTMDEDTDDKDDTKRKTRNLSEKKRRDQFNLLINELNSMVTTNNRKMDKSTVLKSTISFLKNHNDVILQSKANEIQEDWKPSFLTNEEFTHLFLEALDGFIMVFASSGRILYASESITSLLGHFPNDLLAMTVYDMVYEGDHSELYNIFLNPSPDFVNLGDTELSFTCHCRRGGLERKDEATYEVVQFLGHFRSDMDSIDNGVSTCYSSNNEADTRWVFVGTGRLQTPQLIRELSVIDSSKSEFTSRHSLEWKFLFLDHRAPPIIGYLPFEVLGTSGYDYYHVDDLDNVVRCHEALIKKGEGTSCYYRFLTKGQQWIWLQTRFYITYHQWHSKPEFIVCTHRVVSYLNVLNQENSTCETVDKDKDTTRTYSRSQCIPKPTICKQEKLSSSDTNSLSADSPHSRHSLQNNLSSQLNHVKVTCNVNSETKNTIDEKKPYPATSFAVLSVPTQPVLTAIHPHMVDQLKKRQEELQLKIAEQQNELRKVTEQLFLAKYGLFPPVINTAPVSNSEVFVAHPPPAIILEPHPHQTVPVPVPVQNSEVFVTHPPPAIILEQHPHQIHGNAYSLSTHQSELLLNPSPNSTHPSH